MNEININGNESIYYINFLGYYFIFSWSNSYNIVSNFTYTDLNIV